MAADYVLTETRDQVLYVILNRPDRLNALVPEMMGALVDSLEGAAHDSSARCVVLTGAGRGFCAGGDVAAMQEPKNAPRSAATLEERVARLQRYEEASVLLHEMHKVTIAAVNGPAMGAGLSLAAACDLRLAADNARFGTAFARVGFSGDYGGTYSITRVVGSAKARELYFLADIIDANEALRIGLVNRVFPAASFKDEAHAIAKQIANGPTVAYAYMKANLNAAAREDIRQICEREAYGQIMASRTEDHKEAVKAFLEKREPVFRGR